MNPLTIAKEHLRDALERRAMRRHRSLIGWRDAPRYTDYLERCRSEAGLATDPGGLADAVAAFRRDGVTSFQTPETERIAGAMMARIRDHAAAPWDTDDLESGNRNWRGDLWNDVPELEDLFRGPLGDFLTAHFGCPFKILHGMLYRSRAVAGRRDGSQLWHSDGGPGICVNVMFYLEPCSVPQGGIEVLPWPDALTLFETAQSELRHQVRGLPRKESRAIKAAFYEREIEDRLDDRVVRPASDRAGLVVPFLNNTLHRGGFPTDGGERFACVFHCYPSHRPTDWARYRERGIAKTVPYPRDPSVEF